MYGRTYEERQREREIKHAEYLARQQERDRKHAEYLVREQERERRRQEKERKHAEYLVRQQERESRKAAFQHLENGAYVFRKIVLSWTPEQIRKPLLESISQPALLPGFNYYNEQAINNYYQSFLPLILEDARVVLQTGLELIDQHKPEPTELRIRQLKLANSTENPSSFHLEGKLPENTDYGVSSIALLLQNTNDYSRLIVLADIKENGQITGKAIIPSEVQFNEGTIVRTYVLGSLVTHLRMYEVCIKKPLFGFIDEVIQGLLQPYSYHNERLALPSSLNDSQKIAIESFVNASSGLQLLQGPPGTGKTTTIIELLKVLVEKGQRVLVCTPSNKAVQVIAKRTMQMLNDCPIILAGVEAKVDESLKPIFLNTWAKNIAQEFQKFIKFLKPDANKKIKLTKISIKNLKEALQFLNRYPIISYSLHSVSEKIINLKVRVDQEGEYLFADNLTYQIQKELTTIIQQLDSLNISASSKNTNELENRLLNCAKIIFATLSVTGRQQLQDMHQIDVLIVDEAGQAVEAETLIPFALNPKKCLLVGDTKQLPATVKSQVAQKKNYHWSMLWRLLEECRQPYNVLTVQYRMHPEIRSWPSKQYYQNRLVDGENVTTYKELKLITKTGIQLKPYFIVNVNGREKLKNQSYSNEEEIEVIKGILDVISKKNKPHLLVIGIISFYSSQVKILQGYINKNKDLQQHVKVSTVDGFQGDECDVIIISCVRANKNNHIGFLDDFRRLNVAITRAKQSLIIVGNVETLENSQSEDFRRLIADARKRNLIYISDIFKDELFDHPNKETQKNSENTHSKHENKSSFFNERNPSHQKLGKTEVITQAIERINIQDPSPAPKNNITSVISLPTKPVSYKKTLCRFFQQDAQCSKGDKCTFAHGETELYKFGKNK